MTSRVAALSGDARITGKVGAPKVYVTPEIVDRAAESVLSDYEPSVAQSIARNWETDADNDVAVMLRAGAAAQADNARFPKGARISANIPYRMSEEEMRSLIDHYPEMKLTFNTSALHDHGVGAATRHLDSIVARSEIPPGMKFADFGGNDVSYCERGELNVVVVKDTLDAKDPSREPRAEMRLQVVKEQNAAASQGTRQHNSHMMAASMLAGSPEYRVRSTLQKFSQPMLAGMMIHVYDVPITAIPFMMERCGMKMMLIVLHFSNRFFDTHEGELKQLEARYRIDAKSDRFEFGFVGSGARWYSHKWSDFRRYGADQILQGENRRYSYKIIRRRGDTISCRVLEIDGAAVPNPDQYYRVPDVPCVRVTADLTSKKHGYGSRIDEIFPEDVWNRMVRECALDFIKGTSDYNKSVGNYAQITAGSSYNGVDAVLGTVEPERVPLLVALATVSGAAAIARMRAGIRYGLDLEMDQRALEALSLPSLTLQTFVRGFLAVVSAPLRPFVAGLEALLRLTGRALLEQLVEVEPVSQIRRVPSDIYLDVVTGKMKLPREDFPARQFLDETRDMQQFLEDMVESSRKPVDVDIGEHVVDGVPTTASSTTAVEPGASGSGAGAEAPSWMPLTSDDMKREIPKYSYASAERKAAIKEEVEVVRMEAANTEAWMALRWSEIVINGQPDKDKVHHNRDLWDNLDLWHVNRGVVQYSLLGKKVADFYHSGVYCPEQMSVASLDGTVVQTCLRPVEEHTWSDSSEEVQRVHRIIAGPHYTGWVIVNDDTVVHNGPLVINGLLRSLKSPMDFELGVYLGGPGAGKTYEIMNRYTKGQQITSPLVKSVDDARSDLVKKHGLRLLESQRVVRTIDSWLCIAGQGRALPYCGEILADEVYNGRPSRQFAVWGMMRAKRVVGYGDDRQIPPVEPSRTARLYPELAPAHIVRMFKIWRYGPEVLAMIAKHYDFKLRSMRPRGYTECINLGKNVNDYKPMCDDYVIIGAYQAHKSLAKKRYPWSKGHVHTIHEVQGKTVEEVHVTELEVKKRTSYNLYQDPAYINVALSRVTKRLVVSDVTGATLLGEWFNYSLDPRRVAACADVASAGTSVEFA